MSDEKRRRQVAQQRILVVDDHAAIRALLKNLLEDDGFQVLEAQTGRQALTSIEQQRPDLVLMDIKLPDITGIDVLQQLKTRSVQSNVILMTAYGTSNLVIRGTELGAVDYLPKPFQDLDNLLSLVRQHLSYDKLEDDSAAVREVLDRDPKNKIIGNSPRMVEVFKMIGRIAPSEVTVLITGETGTGKNLVAAAIHNYSSRRLGPYVDVACAALPETLLESELFGHEKGAFTNAVTMRKGRFELADKGTIFLDEIGEMTLSTQKKLLRVLQDKSIERLGSGVAKPVDVRVVTATNRPLEEDIEAGRFREDLYYRLNVIAIHMPALRERMDDIPLLVDYFLNKYRLNANASPTIISQQAMARLMEHQWPGNVRELENVIQRAVTLSGGRMITPDHLQLVPLSDSHREGQRSSARGKTLPESLAMLERQMITEALSFTQGDLQDTAKLLGITPAYLAKKMQQYSISAPPTGGEGGN
jgi:two-component system, NtrC family, response regulator AtoC